jgi:diguanylate cyclase (GGDEF)-like protein/PAS domain S-box-containing protein
MKELARFQEVRANAVLVTTLPHRLTPVTKLAGACAILQFATLLLFGAHIASAAAVAAVIATSVARGRNSSVRIILDGVTALAAMQAAGAVYTSLSDVSSAMATTWPMRAVPIGLAILAHSIVEVAARELVEPLVRRLPIATRWLDAALDTLQANVIAVAVAALLVELIARRLWGVLAVATVPLFFLARAYGDYVDRMDADTLRQNICDAVAEGVAFIDRSGRVSYWSDGLERLLTCPRDRVMGQSLVAAVPTLSRTALPRALEAAASAEAQAGVVDIQVPNGSEPRVIQVRVVPMRDGISLSWQDVTSHRSEEQALKRREERLALAAAGASDGLWEWDLATKELYVSSRWKTLLGLPEDAVISSPDQWLTRVHPDDLAELKEALDAHLAGRTEYLRSEHRLLHEDGSYRWCLCHGVAARGTRRTVRIGGSLLDVTERVLAHERLRTAGFLDPLTGLCNRTLFVEGIGRRLEECKRRGGGRFALLYLDLDRFKVVNDSLGHLVGDELLVAVARRLESCVRSGDSLARLGGDEFAILITTLAEDQQANAAAFRIQEALRAPLSIAGREVFTSASIGIAFGPAQYTDPDEIMRDADTAMYHAKSRGKARHEVFDADMHARVRDRLGLESDLRHAVSNNNFEVHYQPIVSLTSGMCVGFESLVRWTRNGTPVSPATFIPMAEELGLIESIGTWVLQEACARFADWQRRFPDAGLDYITVNVSSRQLMQHNFLRIVERAVHQSGLNPTALRLEITETALMDSPAVASEALRELRDLGVKIYLDDFGTGYSSLSHLHKLPVDALKIDRSFVKSLLLPDRPAIVESVLALARTLNTSVVAEGIESDRQACELERLGCTHAQGFLFSRPLPSESAEAIITAHQPLGHKREREVVVDNAETLVPAGPFEWPAHINVR